MVQHADGGSRTWSVGRDRAGETLTELVEAARGGDERAWSRLHADFTPTLKRIAAGYRLGEADAADVIQSTWSKCFEHLAKLREPEALPGWLSTTCHREAIGTLRARAKCVPVDYSTEPVSSPPVALAGPAPATDPLAAIVDSETHREVRSLLDELAERDRSLMWALVEDDASYRRIAESMDMAIGSIGPTRQRIITKLRRRARVLDIAA